MLRWMNGNETRDIISDDCTCEKLWMALIEAKMGKVG